MSKKIIQKKSKKDQKSKPFDDYDSNFEFKATKQKKKIKQIS